MTAPQLRSEIDRLINTLYSISLAIDSTIPIVVTVPGQSVATWTNDMDLSSLFGRGETIDEYVELLRRRWYTVVLADGGLLQLSYTFVGSELRKHRLCFYPCPLRFSPSDLEQFSIQELLELLSASELRTRLRLEGPLRFDYDLEAGTNDHPPSHLTISRASCRIPVSAPLSVGHFVRFVFTHFYPAQFIDNQELREWTCSTGDSCLPNPIEEDRLYVHWRRRL